MNNNIPIVVLTPVKNEAWILDRFLATCSNFAELIIVADQQSTDGSRLIYPRFERAVVIDNPVERYDEASRQKLLLAEARKRISGPKVILALDADEIVAANAFDAIGWKSMLAAKPGTVLCFEKPEIYLSPDKCIRWRDNPYPMGYVDDGAEHSAKAIHSIRVPQSVNSPRLALHDVKVLHFAMMNPVLHRAKFRFYSVTENVMGLKSGIKRRGHYDRNWMHQFRDRIECSQPEWFAGWSKLGIDLTSIAQVDFPWQDFEVLRSFASHGCKQFYWDDIWDVNWEERRQYAIREGFAGIPNDPIRKPGRFDQWWRDRITALYKFASKRLPRVG